MRCVGGAYVESRAFANGCSGVGVLGVAAGVEVVAGVGTLAVAEGVAEVADGSEVADAEGAEVRETWVGASSSGTSSTVARGTAGPYCVGGASHQWSPLFTTEQGRMSWQLLQMGLGFLHRALCIMVLIAVQRA